MALIDLIRPRSREQVVARMLDVLAAGRGLPANSFPLTNYISGDPLRTLLEIAGEGISDSERMVTGLGENGYLATASGPWLDVYTESQYGVARQPSTFARGLIRFYATPISAIQVPAGMILGTLNGLKFLSAEAVTVPPGGYADVEIRAEGPGNAYNVLSGTITIIHTPLPGLSASNLAGWLLEAGADTETDAALRARAGLRWAEQGGGATAKAYEYWALTAHPAVDRVRVLDEHPRGQGTVDVIVWGTGGLGNEVVEAVNTYIQERRPVTADVQVYSARPSNTAFTLDLYAPGMIEDGIRAQVLVNLDAYARSIEIGSHIYSAALIEAAMLPAGVLDATLNIGNIKLDQDQAAVLIPTLTFRAFP